MAVSAVLMGTGGGRIGVSSTTAERIRQIADELGYRPNAAARQLAGMRSGVIAIVAHDWKNFLAQRVLSWLHEAAEGQGFRLMALRAPTSLEPITQLIRDVQAGWIDGIVYLAHENEPQWKPAAELLRQTPAVVTVVGDVGTQGVTNVSSDVESGAKASIIHLKERGFQSPVLITEELQSTAIQTRIKAYEATALECGIRFDSSRVIQATQDWNVSGPDFYPQFRELAQTILNEFQADSVLCDTDFTAVGLLRAFRQLNIQVPDRISIIGWGDLQFAAMFDPRITTVTHQLPDLLNTAVSRLHRQIDTHSEAGAVDQIEMKLLPRETT